MSRRGERGFTFFGFVILLALAGGIYWLVSFGPAYWDNLTVRAILREAGNFAYHETNDEKVRDFVFNKLHETFDENVEERGRIVRQMRFQVERNDLQIERSQIPPRIDLWIAYSREIPLPLVNQRRTLQLSAHASQDLSPVKW